MTDFEERLGHRFTDAQLKEQALTHPSWRNEHQEGGDNQRLEFLGDAVLELVVSALLYENHPEANEGDLTRARAALVCEDSLAEVARRLEIGSELRLGKGENLDGGAEKPSVLADAYEALLGAVFLDGGLPAVRACVQAQLGERVTLAEAVAPERDAKSRLQEHLQALRMPLPLYSVVEERGPDHERRFLVRVSLPDGRRFEAQGRSRKDAEQNAARAAVDGIEADA